MDIRKEDIEEKFIRSQGPGGQNVNKTSTCVYLRHIPTGITVKCQQERSQAQNREAARRMLAEKVERARQVEEAARRGEREKRRRRERRRSAGSKERMLESKKRRARVKAMRGRVREF